MKKKEKKNSQPQAKFTGSYKKKKSVHDTSSLMSMCRRNRKGLKTMS